MKKEIKWFEYLFISYYYFIGGFLFGTKYLKKFYIGLFIILCFILNWKISLLASLLLFIGYLDERYKLHNKAFENGIKYIKN